MTYARWQAVLCIPAFRFISPSRVFKFWRKAFYLRITNHDQQEKDPFILSRLHYSTTTILKSSHSFFDWTIIVVHSRNLTPPRRIHPGCNNYRPQLGFLFLHRGEKLQVWSNRQKIFFERLSGLRIPFYFWVRIFISVGISIIILIIFHPTARNLFTECRLIYYGTYHILFFASSTAVLYLLNSKTASQNLAITRAVRPFTKIFS